MHGPGSGVGGPPIRGSGALGEKELLRGGPGGPHGNVLARSVREVPLRIRRRERYVVALDRGPVDGKERAPGMIDVRGLKRGKGKERRPVDVAGRHPPVCACRERTGDERASEKEDGKRGW